MIRYSMRNFKIQFLAFMIFLMTQGSAVADGLSETQVKRLNNLQSEISECAMFYSISEGGLQRNGSPEALKNAEEISVIMGQMVEVAATVGSSIGMNQEAMQARFELMFNDMMEKMENNFVNYSILLKQYGKTCATLHETMLEKAISYLEE